MRNIRRGSRFFGCLLLFAVLFAFAQDELVNARRRPKREKKCSLRVLEDGRYSVVCTKQKGGRKVSRKGDRVPKSSKNIKATNSVKMNLLKKTLESRTVRNKWKRSAFVCRNSATSWTSKKSFPYNELDVKCNPRELLQGFSVQMLADKIRYKFSCCSFP